MIRLLYFLVIFFTLPVMASESDCTGTWRFNVEQSQAQKRHKDDTSVWIPMQIHLDKSFSQCNEQVTFHFSGSQEFTLKGNNSVLDVQWFDEKYHQLSRNSQGLYFIPINGRLTQKVWLRLPNTTIASPGLYKGKLSLKLGNANQKTQWVRYRVKPVVSMDINASKYAWMNGSGTHYRVNLGQLKEGVNRHFDIDVASNTNVRMTLDAENGNLMHDDGQSTIPYRLFVNGQSVSATHKQRLNLGQLNNSRKVKVPVVFTVGNMDFASAGHYSEQLSITVTAY